jgi:hypothetical protein
MGVLKKHKGVPIDVIAKLMSFGVDCVNVNFKG